MIKALYIVLNICASSCNYEYLPVDTSDTLIGDAAKEVQCVQSAWTTAFAVLEKKNLVLNPNQTRYRLASISCKWLDESEIEHPL